MKKLGLLCLLSLLFVACSSDDDTATVDPLVGNWRMTQYVVEDAYDFNEDGSANTNLLAEVDCYQNETIQINADGTAIAISNSFLIVTAELVIGTPDQFTYVLTCETETEATPLTWSTNGSAVSFIEDDGFTTNATLTSNTQLTFTVPGGFEISSNDGTTLVIEEDVTIVYTKL
ncbi:MAG: hypothetical protein AAF617_16090 [Bacteroidota bacterium]